MVLRSTLLLVLSLSGAYGCRGDAVGAPADASGETSVETGVETGTDSGSVDSGAEVSDAAGANLLDDGTFDLGCARWQDYSSVLTDEASGHSASKACQVCRLSDAYFFVAQSVYGAFAKGQKYQAKAWIRSAAAKPVAGPVGFVLEGTDTKDVVVEYVKGATQPVTSAWTEVQAILEVKTGAAIQLHLRVGASFASGSECFVVDDATLVRIE